MGVVDGCPEYRPALQARPVYACTGWGLALVEDLSSAHGVPVEEHRKTVWFALWSHAPAPPSSPWEAAPPSGRTAPVTLTDLPHPLYLAAQQHREALLRELTLVSFTGRPTGVRHHELVTAQDISSRIPV
ncbi:hypothetical protein [Streptomyces sp. NPDC046759]|uniref:hypothetical protein n=1 Tax=Streptomyces sp. NPDC046759 TaxID=3155019 RepID=UPI00340A42DE